MSQLNRNAAYVYDVDGVTIWERLRVLKTFLADRKKALALAELASEEIAKKLQETDGVEKKRLLIETSDHEDLTDDCRNEIAFLEKSIEELSIEAEKTRIPGKSDKEMYELNFFNEHTQRLCLKAVSEVMSCGHVTPNTMLDLIKNKQAMHKLVESKILDPNVLVFLESSKNLLPDSTKYLGIEYFDESK